MTFLENGGSVKLDRQVLQEKKECDLVATSEREIIFCEQFKTVKDETRAVEILKNAYLIITRICGDCNININPPSTLTDLDKNSLSKIHYQKLLLKYEELLGYLSQISI